MNFEKMQDNEVLDIYRIQNGTLLYVKKYKHDSLHRRIFYGSDFLKITKPVKGCKGLREFKQDFVYTDHNGATFTVETGALALNNHIIKKVDKNDYIFELKSNEGLHGTKNQIEDVLENLKKLINSY